MNSDKTYSLLCIHQGNELYGSDRVFADSVVALRDAFPTSKIDIILPAPGKLENLIRASCDNIRYNPLWVLRKSDMIFPGGLRRFASLPVAVVKAMQLIRRYDFVYINTIVVMNFLFAVCLSRKASIVHIHELISGAAGKLAGAVLRASPATVVCNSNATASAFGLSRSGKCRVIWNGTEVRSSAPPPRYNPGQALKVLLPGRLNSWKGQQLLVEAVAGMDAETRNCLQVRIVGDVYKGQHHFKENIVNRINEARLSNTIEVLGFHREMDEMYRWADVVAVPSTAPEPFGMVAIEAMSHARPVIAARHGGLLEIVTDGRTGWFFTPGSTPELSKLLSSLVKNRKSIEKMGAQAYQSVNTIFSKTRYRRHIGDLTASILERHTDRPKT